MSYNIQRIPVTEEDLKFCNCASCEKLLLGDSFKRWYKKLDYMMQKKLPEPVFTRIFDRPYCEKCTNTKMGGKRRYIVRRTLTNFRNRLGETG